MKKLLYLFLLLPFIGMAQSTGTNYVKTLTYKDPTTTTNPNKAQVQVSYIDGLGRVVQTVLSKAGDSGQDIITPVEYDAYNRQVTEYLPYAVPSAGTILAPYYSNAATNVISFYNTQKYEDTRNPYSQKYLESSPLSRPLLQAAPGSDWGLSQSSYANFTQTLSSTEVYNSNPGSGFAYAQLQIVNNTISFSIATLDNVTNPSALRQSPVTINYPVPNIDLGEITDLNGQLLGYKAVLQDNKLYYVATVAGSLPIIDNINTTLSLPAGYITSNGHTVKYDYQTNVTGEVRRFVVEFGHDGSVLNTEKTSLACIGYYGGNNLYKNITKDENWTPADNHNKTTEEFKDKLGRIVLKRTYELNIKHDTYYVYDEFSNLTYVIPPLAADDVAIGETTISNNGTNYNWTQLSRVSQELADNYSHALQDYDNSEILNVDLLDQYGGQGGFTLSANANGSLSLALNITTTAAMPYRIGVITKLDSFGTFTDKELGRIKGTGYEYIFLIRSNKLEVTGQGAVPSMVTTLTGDTPLEYSHNYPWTSVCKGNSAILADYNAAIAGLDNSEILTTYTPNTYGAAGGVAISVDEFDTVNVSINISSTTALELVTGNAFPLEIERRLEDRELGAAQGYTFRISNNTLMIEGSGTITDLTFSASKVTSTKYTTRNEVVEGLCYTYHYDKKNRVVEKYIPGAKWTFMVYDKLDRLVMTQDENLRRMTAANVGNDWLFTKYDALGRIVYTGLYTGDTRGGAAEPTRLSLQAKYDTPSTVLNESRTTTNFLNSGANIYYSTSAFPNGNYEVYTVNYYDNYTNLNLTPTTVLGVSIPTSNFYTIDLTTKLAGLPTVTRTRTLETTNWTTTATGYDAKAQPIWIYSNNTYLGMKDQVDTQLNFTGSPVSSRTIHTKTGSPDVSTTITDTYSYDSNLRPVNHYQAIGTAGSRLISWTKYDELGKAVKKKVGSLAQTFASAQATFETLSAFQTIDYTYNVRGWLKGINDTGENLSNSSDLFAFKINYNTKDITASTPLYNGNIDETHWRSITDNVVRSYSYQYDALNRLTNANYIGNHKLKDNTAQTENYKEGLISYDKNGNIMHLERWGLKATTPVVIDKIDLLTYKYVSYSNELVSVTDNASKTDGFTEDSPSTLTDYGYLNGNMTSDANKGITAITYNHLNLPKKVTFSSTKFIDYVYDATGTKLEKKVTDGTTITTTQYDGGFIYDKVGTVATLQSFMHPEGYVKKSGTTYSYIYQYKDHLGNVRLSYSDADGNGIINDAQVFKENFETQGGWSAHPSNTATIIYGTDQKHSGSASAKIVNTSATNTEVSIHSSNVLAINNATATNYTFSGWVYSNGPSADIFIFGLTDTESTTSYGNFFNSVSTTAVGSWTFISKTISVSAAIKKLYLRLDNNSKGTVWFDDLQIIKTGAASEIIEENNYYAFGMMHKGYNYAVNTTGSSQAQRYKYQEQERNEELELNWDSFKWRNYDFAIGRFFNIDPLAEKYQYNSTYAFQENKMGMGRELEGLELVPGFLFEDTMMLEPMIEPVMEPVMEPVFEPVIPAAELSGIEIAVGKPTIWENISNVARSAWDSIVGSDEASEATGEAIESAKPVTNKTEAGTEGAKAGGIVLTKPGKGKGSVPPDDRDPKRVWSKKEKKEMLEGQNGKCADCGKEKSIEQVQGHHIKRHADGGQTVSENGAALCKDCHTKIHN